MKGFKININKTAKHVTTWVFITLYILIVDPVTGTPTSNLFGTIVIMLNYVFVYYFIALFVFKNYWNKSIVATLVLTAFTLSLFILFDLFIFFKLIPAIGGENPYTVKKIITSDLILFTILCFASLTYYFNQLALQKLKTQNEREKTLIVKELNFLKGQFNSHVTMNFLNFCYSNVHETLPKTAEAIELFSNILRYTLQARPDKRVALTEEIEYIENYITLQKLLTTKVSVNFITENKIIEKQIQPMILITLVENAFKHGQYNDPSDPIVIILKVNRKTIEFRIENKVRLNNKRQSTGVGLANMKQVLELFYTNNYKFSETNTGLYYTCALVIND